MRLGSHGGSHTISTLASRTPGTLATAFSTLSGSSCADGQFGRCQRHLDRHRPLVGNVDLVDQAKLENIGGDFRVVDGLKRGNDLVGQPRDLPFRQRRRLPYLPRIRGRLGAGG